MDKKSDYLYDLPESQIAQTPLDRRDSSRLLVYHLHSGKVVHTQFHHLVDFLDENDIVVVNDTRVIPARLIGHRDTGGEVELLLLEETEANHWLCLAKPAKRLKKGATVSFPGKMQATILTEGEEGRRVVTFSQDGNFWNWLEEHGRPPLPPYIKRPPVAQDVDRYQTVYASEPGAVAAPTAGLHFTPELLARIREKGVRTTEITLHVGIGTFRPVTTENLADHRMDEERYHVSSESAQAMNRARKNGGKIIAVGTTVVRTLESVTDEKGTVHPGNGRSALFIRPPYRFKAVDAMITNFHLPGSTLIVLVSSLMGREETLRVYNEAVSLGYRFFSYGDAMLIIP